MPVTLHAQSMSGAAREQVQRIPIAAIVQEASQRFGLPERWIYAVIRAESAGRIRAVSSAGAMGLMQLMPGTWTRQRARFGLGHDPFEPRDNILAGTSYLREMYDRFGFEGFLAAYNAGPGRYREWLTRRRPLPLETRRYITRIAPQLQHDGMLPAGNWNHQFPTSGIDPATGAVVVPLMETDEGLQQAGRGDARDAPGHDLFVPLSKPRADQ